MENSSWVTISPRISFSHDLSPSDGAPMDRHRRLDSTLLDSAPDFDFCIGVRNEHQSVSSADELFSNGKILPLQFKNPVSARTNLSGGIRKQKPLPAISPKSLQSNQQQDQKKERLKEILAVSDADEKPAVSRSFWRFTRSSSLNFGSSHKVSLICSLPILSRSNSTGSANSNQRRPPLKDNYNYKSLHKHQSNPSAKPPSLASSSSLHKPPLKKNNSGGKTHFGSRGNGIQINPVLNVPPCISKGSMNLFGFGYFFCNGKDHKNKKKSTESVLKSRSASV